MKAIFEFLIEKDAIFRQIVALYGLPEIIPSRPEGFETLVLLILEQQVSIDSAKATYLKLRSGVGEINPQNVVDLTEEEFRVYGVSRQKARYISHLALAVLEKRIDLESLSSKNAEQVRAELIQLKGIGNWTIDVYLMFALQKPDVLPLGDVAIVNTMKEFLNLQDKAAMDEYAQRWSPNRTYASFLLWLYYLKKRGRTITYQY